MFFGELRTRSIAFENYWSLNEESWLDVKKGQFQGWKN
jgi:hypothetical protein